MIECGLAGTDMSQHRPHHSPRSTLALVLGLAALLVAIIALVVASLGGSAKGPKNVHLQWYRAVLLPTRPDEPPAQDLMGASAAVESESEGTAHRPERGAVQAPWYGLCPYKSVASLDDFRRVVGSDQRLAAYYGGFHWDKARLVTTAAPRLVYVSYQKAGALARTKYPLLLPKGDTLLTDGVLQARTYCCNEVFEIVDAPPPPPSEGEQPASPLPPSPQALWPPESPLSLAPPAGETPPSELVAPPGVPPFSPPLHRETCHRRHSWLRLGAPPSCRRQRRARYHRRHPWPRLGDSPPRLPQTLPQRWCRCHHCRLPWHHPQHRLPWCHPQHQ